MTAGYESHVVLSKSSSWNLFEQIRTPLQGCLLSKKNPASRERAFMHFPCTCDSENRRLPAASLNTIEKTKDNFKEEFVSLKHRFNEIRCFFSVETPRFCRKGGETKDVFGLRMKTLYILVDLHTDLFQRNNTSVGRAVCS